ncbi:DUF2459 domain-containing protein [Pseudorhodobacter ferrugineus]|uniref:DUF2459 domain-containing protein n=1 Tax=Pseudorhodobacter ferrugineus TaxID=77008 RepID=UPI00041ABD4B|nr:DUF2459 domain-containing protein [Pseudorhodobacter ferrugineus]
MAAGWGARGFYTSTATLADMQAATAWRAATGDTAVIRLDVLGKIDTFDGIDQISPTDAEITALVTAVLASFSDRATLPLAGFTETDTFFAAKARFNLFDTCNTWIGSVLRAAGLPFVRWTPFSRIRPWPWAVRNWPRPGAALHSTGRPLPASMR